MRWLIAIVVAFAVASPASAGIFKPRDKNRTKRPPPAVVETKAAPPVAPKGEPAKKAVQPKSAVATKGRPDDLTPKPKAKKKPKKDGDVVIVEDKEDDVIVKDDD